MTRIEKYRDLRNLLENENLNHKEELKSNNLLTRLKAMYTDSFKCKGKRGK